MEPRKWALVTGILLVGIISGNLAHSSGSGRSAKVLEDPTIPQSWSSYETLNAVQDTSDRSLSVERNMMLYRTVFTLSLKLLTVFFIIKLFGQGLAGSGMMRQRPMQIAQFQPGSGGGAQSQMQQYPVDVNHNPATSFVTATSTGAAAGAADGGAAGVAAGAGRVPVGGYISAQTNPRPSFIYPRFRFGGLRLPPPRRPLPPPHMMGQPVSSHNMGTETHLVETHSALYVMPDGTQARIPMGGQVSSIPAKSAESSVNNNVASTSTSDQSPQSSNTETKSADVTAESRPVETIVSTSSSTSSSSSSPQVAERRSSLAYREKLHQLQQAYEDWNLHFNPGTRSL